MRLMEFLINIIKPQKGFLLRKPFAPNILRFLEYLILYTLSINKSNKT